MATSQEQVLITINAVDNASKVLNSIKTTINQIASSASKSTKRMGDALSQPVKSASGEISSVANQTMYSLNGFGESARLAGSKANMSFSEAAATMDKYHVGLNRVTNAMTGLFGTMGLFGMAHQSWVQSTQRQTNQVYLTMRRGTEQAKSMYSEIMQIVMELPGDDTFMTTLLTQASGRDLTMTSQSIRELGDAIADYYVAATAKGQLTYETQRELTSYILTGETRMFTNSVLAAEIDLLKDKNTVTERATALQEALTKSGFEGMAHYKTATNAMEEFKGHFQKAFADIGSATLPVIQAILTLYNTIDGLFGGGISASIIMFATSVALFTTSLGVIGFITPMINEGVRSIVLFANVGRNAISSIRDMGGVMNYLRSHFRGLVDETRLLIAPTRTVTALTTSQILTQQELGWAYSLTNSALMTETGLVGYNTDTVVANTLAITQLDAQKLALKITTDGYTVSKWSEIAAIDASTMAKINEVSALVGVSEAKLLDMALTSEMSTAEFLETLETNYNTIAKIENAQANLSEASTRNLSLTSIIRNTSAKIYNTLISGLETAQILLLGSAEKREEVIKKSSLLTTLNEIRLKIQKVATTILERIAMASVIEGQVRFNREKAIGIITRLQEIVTTINETATKIANAIATGLQTGAESLSNKEKIVAILLRIKNIALIIAETVAFYGLAGVGLLIDTIFSPMVLTFLAIGGAILLVVSAVEKIGESFGWWTDFGTMIEAIRAGIGRLWEAFMNSEPIQFLTKLIDTFSSFFRGTFKVLNDFWTNLFGDNNGTFDFVESLIEGFGKLYDIVSAVFNFIFPIFPLLQGIAYWMEIFEEAWDQFVDSSEFMEMMEALGEVVTAFIEPFQELWEAFSDVGEAIAEAFGMEEENADSTKEDINWIVGGLKMIANFIKNYIAPALKLLVQFAMPLLWAIRGITGIIGLFTGKDYFTNDTAVNSLNRGVTNYSTATTLTKASNVNTRNNNVIINNNFNEGSVQAKTTMTNEEFGKGITSLLGYNNVYGVGGIGYR